jgi:hypothetical protein
MNTRNYAQNNTWLSIVSEQLILFLTQKNLLVQVDDWGASSWRIVGGNDTAAPPLPNPEMDLGFPLVLEVGKLRQGHNEASKKVTTPKCIAVVSMTQGFFPQPCRQPQDSRIHRKEPSLVPRQRQSHGPLGPSMPRSGPVVKRRHQRPASSTMRSSLPQHTICATNVPPSRRREELSPSSPVVEPLQICAAATQGRGRMACRRCRRRRASFARRRPPPAARGGALGVAPCAGG